MVSIKIKLRPSKVAEREGSLVFQIIHKRLVRQLPSGFRVFVSEWNERNAEIVVSSESDRRAYLQAVRQELKHSMERLLHVVKALESELTPFTADDVITRYLNVARELSLTNFMGEIIFRLKCNGKERTAEAYSCALRNFKTFLKHGDPDKDDIMLDAIDSMLMETYEAWHHLRGNTRNTFSFYARILRAVYRRAVERRLVQDAKPFCHVYTGVDKTVKRALPIAVIRRIRALDLSLMPTLDYARDMFIISFMLRGMSFVDMAFLKKSDLRGGYLVYRRRKTGQRLSIEWTKDMKRLLAKYPENTSDFLLPIIRVPVNNERGMYLRVGSRINSSLKEVALLAGVTIPLSLYVARHSWASAAKAKGIPLSVISEGMGHDNEATTQIYLASLETSVVDRANALILNAI